eukprot:1177422-Prorocentrum_minimum.AAC.9
MGVRRGSSGQSRGSGGGGPEVRRPQSDAPRGPGGDLSVKSRCPTRGAQTSKTLFTIVVNIQESQEQAPCATYWFLGLIQVPEGGWRGSGGGPEGVLQGVRRGAWRESGGGPGGGPEGVRQKNQTSHLRCPPSIVPRRPSTARRVWTTACGWAPTTRASARRCHGSAPSTRTPAC